MSEPENPPAFPVSTIDGFTQDGMTLRDWLAGQLAPVCFSAHHGNDWGRAGVDHAPRSAQQAYAYADAMLAERSK